MINVFPPRASPRLEELRRYGVVDTPPERAFDDLATLAARVCATPIAVVSLVGDDREWFKAHVGLAMDGASLEHAFCAQAIEQREVFVVRDATQDARFAPHPLVSGPTAVRFYAGAPLVTEDGTAVGTVCVMDRVPRDLSEAQIDALRALAGQTMAQLEMRRIRDIDAAKQRAEALLQAITEGTATVTGVAFFASLVRHLASALQVRRVFVAECVENDRARSRAIWMDHQPQPNFEYCVTDTPCMKVTQGETCLYSHDVRKYFPTNPVLLRLNAESYLGVPLWNSSHQVIGHMVLVDDKPMSDDRLWISVLHTFAARAGVELEREQAEERLRAALVEVEALKNRLQAENVYLQEEIRTEHNFDEIVGHSAPLLALLHKIERVADTDSTVLVSGETGCGKELIARALHSRSVRRHRALVKVNCGAVPASLLESELFGHVKGAFTGAIDRRVGRFELADGGTIFLDEIGELPLDTQVKLLRVLQEREFEPVGSSKTHRVDVRIIAATNRDLAEEVKAGRFRSDLFFRLNVVPLWVPPLRERQEDIPLLVSYFVARFAKKFGRRIDGVSQSAMARLVAYPWPGNIRELQNIIERAVVLATSPILTIDPDVLAVPDVPGTIENPEPARAVVRFSAPSGTMNDAERRHIAAVLAQTKGVIEGPAGAAKILNLHPNTLRSRMKKLGVARTGHDIG